MYGREAITQSSNAQGTSSLMATRRRRTLWKLSSPSSSTNFRLPLDVHRYYLHNSSVMKEREYKRLRLSIEADYKHKIAALELVYSMSNESGLPSGKSSTSKGALADAVGKAVSGMTATFNVRQVEEAIRVINPALSNTVKRASISNTLKRLEGAELELVERGRGKRATIYRRRNLARAS